MRGKSSFIILAGIAGFLLSGSVRADVEAGKRKAETCAACHGPNGNSANGMYPVLAGQTARYLYLQLRDFKEERRKDPVMSPMAANLSKEDMQDLSEYFAAQKAAPLKVKTDPEKVKLGAAKANDTLCSMCHLGGLKGQNEIPRLSGQHPEYVEKQLKAFRERTRTNDGGNMTSVSRTLTDDDITNLAQYIASLY
ncbi:Cytochrome c553 [Noviherbaspirillum humi]|uniref:Cytochrome c553 n=1 Tax=Noviherbaspirillum humi TaxID=1688639 RepID=A0A239FGQ2_9BURK|nr:c-type cytochrome [Noviherbaspirillum humi]SNS55244.1 Cytochrome c553 [Noviherbaspirillum humi]